MKIKKTYPRLNHTFSINIVSAMIMIALLSFVMSATAAADTEYRYLIKPGDKMAIMVWPYEDLTMEIQVRPDGMVSYPFIGEFKVEGLSAGEVGEKIAEAVKEYVHEPKVAVNLTQFRQPRIYVLGQVNKPGLYDIKKGDTVLDALSAAGGATKRASLKKVGLIRTTEENEKNKGKVTEVNIAALLGKGEIPEEFLLADGDIIYVPETNKPNWDKISTIVTSLYSTFAIDRIIREIH
ncbi:MAG: polysaccharide biosynthesis/export family protein [bacterium]